MLFVQLIWKAISCTKQAQNSLGSSCKKMGILRIAQAEELIDKRYGISIMFWY